MTTPDPRPRRILRPPLTRTTTIRPPPPFSILENLMVVAVSPHELPATLYGAADLFLAPPSSLVHSTAANIGTVLYTV